MCSTFPRCVLLFHSNSWSIEKTPTKQLFITKRVQQIYTRFHSLTCIPTFLTSDLSVVMWMLYLSHYILQTLATLLLHVGNELVGPRKSTLKFTHPGQTRTGRFVYRHLTMRIRMRTQLEASAIFSEPRLAVMEDAKFANTQNKKD